MGQSVTFRKLVFNLDVENDSRFQLLIHEGNFRQGINTE